MSDAVNHPDHYNKHPSGVECIDIVEHMQFNPGNAVKYIWRADHKEDAIQDLKKAIWYLEREIALRTKALETKTEPPLIPDPRPASMLRKVEFDIDGSCVHEGHSAGDDGHWQRVASGKACNLCGALTGRHRMRCPLYVGQLNHVWTHVIDVTAGLTDFYCSCGAKLSAACTEPRVIPVCPDAAITSRGMVKVGLE